MPLDHWAISGQAAEQPWSGQSEKTRVSKKGNAALSVQAQVKHVGIAAQPVTVTAPINSRTCLALALLLDEIDPCRW